MKTVNFTVPVPGNLLTTYMRYIPLVATCLTQHNVSPTLLTYKKQDQHQLEIRPIHANDCMPVLLNTSGPQDGRLIVNETSPETTNNA